MAIELIDSYVEVMDTYFAQAYVSQSFTASKNATLTSCRFYLAKQGSPTGTAVACLYTHAGAYGTSSVPGTLLATSDTLNVTTIATLGGLKDLAFSGVEQYSMSIGYYCIVFKYTAGDVSNYIKLQADSTPLHSGNAAYSTDGTSWTAVPADAYFGVWGDVSAFIPRITVI